MSFSRIIAIDWSGRRDNEEQSIWVADVCGGVVVLENGRTRAQIVQWLGQVAADSAVPVLVGLDFSFSFPVWFADTFGCANAPQLWDVVAQDGERWLHECRAPFWGRPGRPKPLGFEQFRHCERVITGPGVRPKSTFQVGGAGSVGTGSVRGMALLPTLRAAGWSVWPFDEIGAATVFEMYPRLFTGPVVKSRQPDRERSLVRLAADPRSRGVAEEVWAKARISEDAFDALVSALTISHTIETSTAGSPTSSPLLSTPNLVSGLTEAELSHVLAVEGWIARPAGPTGEVGARIS